MTKKLIAVLTIIAALSVSAREGMEHDTIVTDSQGNRYILLIDGRWSRVPTSRDQETIDRLAIALAKYMADHKSTRPYTMAGGIYYIDVHRGDFAAVTAYLSVDPKGFVYVDPYIRAGGHEVSRAAAESVTADVPEMGEAVRALEALEAELRALTAKTIDRGKGEN